MRVDRQSGSTGRDQAGVSAGTMSGSGTPIASFGMYAIPALRPAIEAWWAGLRRHCIAQGLEDAPEELTDTQDLVAVWRDPALFLSQTCGYPLMTILNNAVRMVATPVYDAPGCEGPLYGSFILVRADDSVRQLGELRGRVAAINDWASQSGMNALRSSIAPLTNGGRFFSDVRVSGSHLASVEMVRKGEADVAAIDCVNHALLTRHMPGHLKGTRIIGMTQKVPALPYVTSIAQPGRVGRLRAALMSAVADPSLASARADLLLRDFEILPVSAYRPVVEMEERAVRLGYPVIA